MSYRLICLVISLICFRAYSNEYTLEDIQHLDYETPTISSTYQVFCKLSKVSSLRDPISTDYYPSVSENEPTRTEKLATCASAFRGVAQSHGRAWYADISSRCPENDGFQIFQRTRYDHVMFDFYTRYSNCNGTSGVAHDFYFSGYGLSKQVQNPPACTGEVFTFGWVLPGGNGEVERCLNPADLPDKNPDDCPKGNFKYPITHNGVKQCVPVDCPSKGTQKGIWANKSTGDSSKPYNNTAGTYCDGQCAYSVGGGQNDGGYTGQIGIKGVSTGAVCGQGSDGYHSQGNEADNCTTYDIEGSDQKFMTCSSSADGGGDFPDGNEGQDKLLDDIENAKDDGGDIDMSDPQNCSPDDLNCNFSNMHNSIKESTQIAVDKQSELHNKSLDVPKTQTENDNRLNSQVTNTLVVASDSNLQGLGEIKNQIEATNRLLGDLVKDSSDSDSDGSGEGDGNSDNDVALSDSPSEGLTGFYVPEYPDGLGDVINEFQDNVKNTEIYNSIEKWDVNISGGHAALMNMCFDLGSMGNYGCHDIKIDSRVYPFIRIIMILGALLLARKLTLGG